MPLYEVHVKHGLTSHTYIQSRFKKLGPQLLHYYSQEGL